MFDNIYSFLSKFVKKYKLQIILFVFLDIILMLVNSVLTQSSIKNIVNLISRTFGGEIFNNVKFELTLLILYNLVFTLGDIFIKYIYLISFSKIRNNIYRFLFNYLERYHYAYFQENFSGNVGNRISKMADSSERLIYNFFDVIVAKGITKVVTLYYIYNVHKYLFFLDIIWMALYVIITTFINDRIRPKVELFEEEKSILSGRIVDSFDNILNVKSFSNKKYERNLIRDQTKIMYSKETELYKTKMIYEGLRTTLSSPLLLVNIFLAIKLYYKNFISLGDISFVVTMSYSIVKSMKYFNEEISSMTEQYGVVKQCLGIISQPLDVKDIHGAVPLTLLSPSISFSNLHFRYKPELPFVFSDLNLSIEPRTKVGIVGYSGSGKSTMVNLLLRFYDVTEGGIYIDKQNIAEVTQESLRNNISYIPQDPILFHRTIADNILYGKLNATKDELIEATKKAHCYDFINNLEDGFNTLVGERGIKLSGGQRQRIAIARALLKNSQILILDEATSALDSITENEIQTALNYLMKDKTVLVIAHRLSTLNIMDRIIVLDKGQIKEDGTKDILLNNPNGLFRRMWEMQREGVIDI